VFPAKITVLPRAWLLSFAVYGIVGDKHPFSSYGQEENKKNDSAVMRGFLPQVVSIKNALRDKNKRVHFP